MVTVPMSDLSEYKKKRDFRSTDEPKGKSPGKNSSKRIFTVQGHDASNMHYDFRLELDGALKSWAVPKGPSNDPSEKRLAVRVEDHPLDYAGFEGVIPEDEYGAGPVIVWDRGTWEPEGDGDPEDALEDGELKFTLHGEKLKGSWVLVKMKGRGDDNWLLIKHGDRHATRQAKKPLVERKPKSVKSGRTIDEVAEEEAENDED